MDFQPLQVQKIGSPRSTPTITAQPWRPRALFRPTAAHRRERRLRAPLRRPSVTCEGVPRDVRDGLPEMLCRLKSVVVYDIIDELFPKKRKNTKGFPPLDWQPRQEMCALQLIGIHTGLAAAPRAGHRGSQRWLLVTHTSV